MQGIPMIASSPVRHDSPLNLQGIDVQTYQPPWKALSDFALHADLDSNGAINTHTPAFQQLVNQVRFPQKKIVIQCTVEQNKCNLTSLFDISVELKASSFNSLCSNVWNKKFDKNLR